jgi:UDP-N-acetylglucosamine:LPS N-acetylglucosamine transferase
LKQADLSGEFLASNIRELMINPQRLQQMSANCARLAPKDAAGRVANTIEKYTTHEARV